jgi:two-component system chemotaxis response regulator CheB
MSELKRIIVVGASAGGFKAISELLSVTPAGLNTVFLVVIHLAQASQAAILRQYFEKSTSYKCLIPADNELINPGCVYFAPADHHMLVKDGNIRLIKGPHENRWRPSVDVLFRSVAAEYNSKAIGIVLSGMLDDGTSGMWAIKRSGGICIVQEPADADYSDMPLNVLNNMDVDYRVPVKEMGYILDDIFSKPAPDAIDVPDEIKLEAEITERIVSSIEDLAKLGTHSRYTCPDCGGGLYQIKNEVKPRFRCHTGHVYTDDTLLNKQNEQLEESVWVSIRMLEERRNLLLQMAGKAMPDKSTTYQQSQIDRANELNLHIERLKALLMALTKNLETDEGYV